MPYGTNREQALPITYHLTGEDAITKNSYWRREWALYSLDENGDEVIWDMTVYPAMFGEIQANYAGAPILSINTANGRVIRGPVGGRQFSFAIELDHSATQTIEPWGLGKWDIVIFDSTGRYIRIMEGNATLSPNVN